MNFILDRQVTGEVGVSWSSAFKTLEVFLEETPEQRIRKIVADAITPNTLPPTKSLQVYYIRAIGEGTDRNNDPVKGVLFPPVFYVRSRCRVTCNSRNRNTISNSRLR